MSLLDKTKERFGKLIETTLIDTGSIVTGFLVTWGMVAPEDEQTGTKIMAGVLVGVASVIYSWFRDLRD